MTLHDNTSHVHQMFVGYVTERNVQIQWNSHIIPMNFVAEPEKPTLESRWKLKIPKVAKPILSKNSKTRHIAIPGFKLNLKAIAKSQHNTDTKTGM